MSETLIDLLTKEKLYPIIRCSDPDEAIEIGHAMIKGGIKILEVNIETPDLYRAVQELSKDAYICAGSIITSLQAQMAIDCGAVMFSSPIFQMNLVKISKNKRVPFIAGVSTANEAYAAWKARVLLTKLFPTTALGGITYIGDLLRQMPFLSLMPTGNIKLDEVIGYIRAGAKCVGVGRDLYADFTPNEITERVKSTLNDIKDYTNWTNN